MSKRAITDSLKNAGKLVVNTLISNVKGADAQKCANHILKVFDHNVAGGKLIRSRLLLDSYTALDPAATLRRLENVKQVAAALEILQSFFLVMDDIMDQSQTRRGRPCWYAVHGVGLNAINDALMLESAVDIIIRDAVQCDPNRSLIKDAICKTKQITIMGQMLDMNSSKLEDCTWKRYENIVRHKTSYYSFFAPLHLALLLADERAFDKEIMRIAIKLGYLFQAQDDYLDCFGNASVTGKVGTDLRDGKCTWITCKTKEKVLSYPSEKKILQENFGVPQESAEVKLKQALVTLGIKEDFETFQKASVSDLIIDINTMKCSYLKPVLHNFLDEISVRFK
ncbi:hypothetical protein AB6A40_005894 [Gnathostoma spinigerum]|uniref:Farnesyl pyrophosphate synthase n=1 Tax=Gnathostoma spinigerum TaxID=75299 RepID=A0ABD6ESF1_9BILA